MIIARRCAAFAPLVAIALLTGCAVAKVDPRVSGQTLIVSQNDQLRPQLVLPRSFQEKTEKGSPEGKKWGSITVDISSGAAASKSLVSFMKSKFPRTVVGDSPSAGGHDFTLSAEDVHVVVGTDDTAAYHTSTLIPLATFGMKADTISRAQVKAQATLCSGQVVNIVETGEYRETMMYSAIGIDTLAEAAGKAVDRAAEKVVEKFATEASSCK